MVVKNDDKYMECLSLEEHNCLIIEYYYVIIIRRRREKLYFTLFNILLSIVLLLSSISLLICEFAIIKYSIEINNNMILIEYIKQFILYLYENNILTITNILLICIHAVLYKIK